MCIDPSPHSLTTYPHAALKQRYISFTPDAEHNQVAFLVTDVASGAEYYISTPRTTPAEIDGEGLTFLVSDSVPPLHDWAALPVVHVGGCMIAPGDSVGLGREYEVTATRDGVNFSAPMSVFTAPRPLASNARFWGDVSGQRSPAGNPLTIPPTPPNAWEPPDPSDPEVTGFDIIAVLHGAAAAPTAPHFTWTDINPELSDGVTNGNDVLRVVNAFGVGTGREWYPFAYPTTPTPLHGPTPPSPALCPPPPLMADLSP